MDEFLGKIFNAVTGVWAIFLAIVVALFRMGPAIMGRLNERRRDSSAEEERDWQRIRHERDVACEERDLVRNRWAACEAEKVQLMQEIARLNGILQGYGEWKQYQAYRDAARRLADREDGPAGGGE